MSDRRQSNAIELVPRQAEFDDIFRAGKAQLVSTKLVADLETPVSAYMKLAKNQAMSFLLESVEGGAVRGRYSIIGLAPDVVWRAQGNVAEINRNPARKPKSFKVLEKPTLDALREFLAESSIDVPEGMPPMAAGVFGYMGYDTVRLVEHLPDQNPDALGVPDSLLIRPTLMVIFDAVKDELTVVTPVRPDGKSTSEKAYAAAKRRLRSVIKSLEMPIEHGMSTQRNGRLAVAEPVSNTAPHEYLAMVDKAKEYIKAGDVFQVVLSQRFSAPFPLPPFSVHQAQPMSVLTGHIA